MKIQTIPGAGSVPPNLFLWKVCYLCSASTTKLVYEICLFYIKIKHFDLAISISYITQVYLYL